MGCQPAAERHRRMEMERRCRDGVDVRAGGGGRIARRGRRRRGCRRRGSRRRGHQGGVSRWIGLVVYLPIAMGQSPPLVQLLTLLRWDSLPALFDHRRGLDYDLASNVACEVEVGGATAAMMLTLTSELVGWTVCQQWGAFDETCRPPLIMMMMNWCNVAYEMRKMSARETYMAHRKYFDGSPGKEGSIDNVSVTHDGNIGSGRVFRYRGGTRIPQSPSKI
jgi:hypothetical protein